MYGQILQEIKETQELPIYKFCEWYYSRFRNTEEMEKNLNDRTIPNIIP